MILQLAFRNLWRHPLRSGIMLAAVGLSLAGSLFMLGMKDGSHRQLIANAIALGDGNVVVCHREHFDKPTTDRRVRQPRAVLDKLAELQRSGRVARFHPRIELTGLLSSANANQGVKVIGLVGSGEREDHLVAKSLAGGRDYGADELKAALADPGAHVITGAFVGDGPELEVNLGDKLARRLRVKLKGKMVLALQGLDGDPLSVLLRVKGIYHTGNDLWDKDQIVVPLGLLQRELGFGEDLTKIAVFTPRSGEEQALAEELTGLLPDKESTVLTWKQYLATFLRIIEADSRNANFIATLIVLISSIGILNVMLMGVLERTRELGLTMSLGMSPARVMGMVLVEASVVSVLALLAGCGLGYLLMGPILGWRMNLSSFFPQGPEAISGVFLDPVIHLGFEPAHLAKLLVSVTLVTFLMGIYPALRAGRLDPLQAMRKRG